MDQTTGPLRVIRAVDPALNPECITDILKYRASRDPELIPKIILAGSTPVYYTIIKPTRRGIRYIRNGNLADDVNERAFAVCVQRVERGGSVLDNPSTKLGTQPCSDGWLDHFAEAELQEIGMVAWTHAFLAPDQPPFFAQLPSLVSGLTAILSLHAEQQSRQEQLSDQSNDGPEEPPPPIQKS